MSDPTPAGGTARCADCGYLSAKATAGDPSSKPVSRRMRDTGERDSPELESAPYCHKGVPDPTEEYHAAKARGGDKKAAYLVVVTRGRNCSEYCAYQHGHSPQEHAEMISAREVQAQAATEADKARQFQAAEAERQRQFQSQLVTHQDALQRERDRTQWERQERLAAQERWWRLVLVVLGAAIGFGVSKLTQP